MHLIGPLCADRASAADGYATIYRRGTTTPATTYTTFGGTGAAAPGRHDLDGYGIAVRYVNELVDVTVYNRSGVKVAGPFTEGVNATAVEIVHAHVTGTSYSDASSGLNKPSTHQLVLDKLYRTFGADDFQLNTTGSAATTTLLKDAVGPIFNVMSSSFGAKGDGVTNDTTAIQAAITAALAYGGGTIWFPPGTYRLTTALGIIGDKIRFQASGDGTATLKQVGAGEYCLSFNHAAGTQSFSCQGIRFEGNAATDSKLITVVNAGAYYDFSNCRFTGLATSGSEMVLNARFRFDHCEFNADASTAAVFLDHQPASLLANHIDVVGGHLSWGTTALVKNTSTLPVSFIGCNMTRANVGATVDLIAAGSTGPIHLTSCAIRTLGPTLRLTIGGSVVRETGCFFGAGVIPLSSVPFYSSAMRDHSSLRSSIAAASYTPDATAYIAHEVVNSNAAHDWGIPTGPPAAAGVLHLLILRYKNTSGGAVTPTFNAAYKVPTPPSVANNSACGWIFYYDTTLAAWVCIGTTGAYAS